MEDPSIRARAIALLYSTTGTRPLLATPVFFLDLRITRGVKAPTRIALCCFPSKWYLRRMKALKTFLPPLLEPCNGPLRPWGRS